MTKKINIGNKCLIFSGSVYAVEILRHNLYLDRTTDSMIVWLLVYPLIILSTFFAIKYVLNYRKETNKLKFLFILVPVLFIYTFIFYRIMYILTA